MYRSSIVYIIIIYPSSSAGAAADSPSALSFSSSFFAFKLDAQTQALSVDEHKMQSVNDVNEFTKQVQGLLISITRRIDYNSID
jgi:hypothetical protein